ncbi:MAG: PKD domain-containing protein [Thermoplasmata archaeon]|nr:PKD domain-containing protein [Thermoplasmata archaeon]
MKLGDDLRVRPAIFLLSFLFVAAAIPPLVALGAASELPPSAPTAVGAVTVGSPPRAILAQGGSIVHPSVAPTTRVVGNWTQLVNSTSTPPTRQSGSMVYDPVAGEYVMFGGSSATSTPLGDTWVFAHENWTDLTANLSIAPSPRWYYSMTWDAADNYVLLFGGRNTSTDFNDTWTFNGTNWTKINTTVAPPPMTSGRIAYDVADGFVWMYGGYSIMPGAPSKYNATWTYKAGLWSNITANVTGAPVDPHTVNYAAYDSTDKYVVLYGGNQPAPNFNCSLTGNTWRYVNGTYVDLTSGLTSAPPVSMGSRMMGDDPAFKGVILYGGWDGSYCGYSNQTWLFHGGNWTNLNVSYNPGPIWDGPCAADPAADSLLLFSGNIGYAQSSATWNFSPAFEVSLAVNQSRGIAPLPVNLTASAVGLAPIFFNWSFGDGLPNASGANVTHTFANAGSYLVRLSAVDGLGRLRVRFVSEHVYRPLVPTAQVGPNHGDVPLTVTFNSTVVGGVPPLSYRWSFGDRSSSLAANVSHTYLVAGHLTWYLNVSDAQGHLTSRSGAVDVAPTLVFTWFSPAELSGIVPLTLAFNVSLAGGLPPYTTTWSFGDGAPSVVSSTASHTYVAAGTFLGNVTVRDQNNVPAVHPFVVRTANPLAANLIVTPLVGVEPLVVSGSTVPTGGFAPYTALWRFGPPGATSTTEVASYIYTTTGNFTGNLTLSDSAGHQVVQNFTIEVVAPLRTVVAADRPFGDVPATFNFTSVLHGGLGPFNTTWAFGDAAPPIAGGSTMVHSYTSPGTYRVSATVLDQLGESSSGTLTVRVSPMLKVALTSNVTSIAFNSSVRLQATITGATAPLRLNWTGLPSTCYTGSVAIAYICTFAQVGTFHITVWVNDSTGRGTAASLDLTVEAPPPPLKSPSSSGGGVPLVAVALVVVVLAAGLIGATLWWRRRPPPPATVEPAEEPPSVEPALEPSDTPAT